MDSLQGRVGSGDQRNTLWGIVEWEGDRHGTHGTSGLIRGPESGPLAAMETGTVVEARSAGLTVVLGIDAGRVRRNFAGHGDGCFNPADRSHARASTVDRQP
jgi:hypothetical protein